jgi:hypothetical protein
MTINSPRKIWTATNAEDRQQCMAELQIEERALVAELRIVGIHVESTWDLVNWRGPPYLEAIPVLLKHLPILYSDRLGEGIARALSRPFARLLAWETVLKRYQETPDRDKSWFKDGLAVALSGMAGKGDVDQLMRLVDDRRNGPTRIFFLKNLARSRSPAALEVIVKQGDDPDLAPEVQHILKRKLKSKKLSANTNH